MGLLKKVFGAIFGVIASLLRLVGIGKKSEFFLELDASQTPAPSTAEVPAATTQTEPAVKAPVTQAAAVEASTAVTSEASAAPAQVTKAPQPTAPVADAPAITFAPDYLMPAVISTKRRRPGANMGLFKDLAKQMGTPTSS